MSRMTSSCPTSSMVEATSTTITLSIMPMICHRLLFAAFEVVPAGNSERIIEDLRSVRKRDAMVAPMVYDFVATVLALYYCQRDLVRVERRQSRGAT